MTPDKILLYCTSCLLLLLVGCSRFDANHVPVTVPEDAGINDITSDSSVFIPDEFVREVADELSDAATGQPEILSFDGLHINEVLFDPVIRGITSDDPTPPLARIELYYAGPDSATLGGLQLALGSFESDLPNGIIYIFPDIEMPPGGFLNLYLIPNLVELDGDEDGFIADDLGLEDDIDYSDGPSGGLYIDPGGILGIDPGGILGIDGDDISLLDNNGNTVAFLAYGDAPTTETGEMLSQAMDQGLWAEDNRVVTSNMEAGESFGLILDGFHASTADLGDEISGIISPNMAAAADYRTYAWETYQITGSQEGSNPIQIDPLNCTLSAQEEITLSWYACPGAYGYQLELSENDAFSSNGGTVHQFTLEDTTYSTSMNGLGLDYFYWRVACLYGNTGQVQTPPSHHWEAGFVVEDDNASLSPGLWIPPLMQRKDSPMLCLYDAANGDREGCYEDLTVQEEDGLSREFTCQWNAPHPDDGDIEVGLCGPIGANYAARAAIQMVHTYYHSITNLPDEIIFGDQDGDGIGDNENDLCPYVPDPEQLDSDGDGIGDLCEPIISQDFISYLTFNEVDPIGIAGADDPEGDMGAGLGMSVEQTVETLSTVLDVATAEITVKESPSFEEIAEWLDAGRPVILFRYWASGGGHVTVVRGYQSSPFNTLVIVDPAYTAPDRWAIYTGYENYVINGVDPDQPTVAIVPPIEPGLLLQDPDNLWRDSDGDLISDFDEKNRLCSDYLLIDSDFDQVPDYEEVRSYTLSRHIDATLIEGTIVYENTHIGSISTCLTQGGFPTPCFDPSGLGGSRCECNCDCDGDGDPDGSEDINGNGGLLESQGDWGGVGNNETDVFDPFSHELSLTITGSDDTHLISGGSFHSSESYTVWFRDCEAGDLDCPSPGSCEGVELPAAESTTDETGYFSFETEGICSELGPGCYEMILDLVSDGVSDYCDPRDTLICDSTVSSCDLDDGSNDLMDIFFNLVGASAGEFTEYIDFGRIEMNVETVDDVGDAIVVRAYGDPVDGTEFRDIQFQILLYVEGMEAPSMDMLGDVTEDAFLFTAGASFWIDYKDDSGPGSGWFTIQVWDPPGWKPYVLDDDGEGVPEGTAFPTVEIADSEDHLIITIPLPLEELLGVDGFIDSIGLDEPPVGAEWGINISNDVVGSDDRDYIPDPVFIGESSEISGNYPTYLLFNDADYCATVTTGTP